MRLVMLCLLCLSLVDCFSQTKKSPSNVNADNKIIMNDSFNKRGQKENITYEISGSAEKKRIRIKYVLENKGAKNYLIFNRGDTNYELKKGRVYVQPQTDGTVEISQRKFDEPTGAGCPDREYPVRAGASWLKAGQKISEEIEIELPLKGFTPFQDCPRLPPLPKIIKNVKFCLGIAEADVAKVSIKEDGFVENWQNVKEQTLICTESFTIK